MLFSILYMSISIHTMQCHAIACITEIAIDFWMILLIRWLVFFSVSFSLILTLCVPAADVSVHIECA